MAAVDASRRYLARRDNPGTFAFVIPYTDLLGQWINRNRIRKMLDC